MRATLSAVCRLTWGARKAALRRFAFAGVAAALVAGCGDPTYPSRQALTVDSAAVTSLTFSPAVKFILADSQSHVALSGYHTGYRCTEILEAGLDSLPADAYLFSPVLRMRLPATPDCALDSSAHDTLLTHVFHAAQDTQLFLANSSGSITDSAWLVHGKSVSDSFVQALDSLTLTAASGRWLFRDSTELFPRLLFVDSLAPCEILERGEFAKQQDTVKVRIFSVTLDSAYIPGGCSGKARQDSLPLAPGTF